MAAQEHHKIFAWKEGNYWKGQQLLPVSQIRGLLAALAWKREVFATIQNYDEYGNCLSCPFYFDLDGSDDRVLADARQTVAALDFLLNITPRIYFSGNKGFHLIIEHVVEHSQCHLLVKEMARELALAAPSIDMAVYRTNSMFRIPGSPASKPGFYKIELHKDELFSLSFEQIRELARAQRWPETHHTPDSIDTMLLRDWMEEMTKRLPRYDSIKSFTHEHPNLELDFTPCLRRMLSEGVDMGQRNYAAFLLAKFFRSADLTYENALDMFMAHAVWKDYEADGREVTKVVRSVYRSHRQPVLGCRGDSQGAELMRAHCSTLCFLNPQMDAIVPVDDRRKA